MAVPALLALAALAACASSGPSDPAATPHDDAGSDASERVEEIAEAPLGLLAVDGSGSVALIDLAEGSDTALPSIGAPTALATDGRYAFVSTAEGLQVIDSGRWTWDHGDHFHYYRASPGLIGAVPGDGSATVSTGLLSTAGATGVFFAGSGEAVLIENAALDEGEIVERFRIRTGQSAGLVAPLRQGALVAIGDELVFHDRAGAATPESVECVDPLGTITTRVGLVVGCADGAVLATWDGSAPVFERIPYPADVAAERVSLFDGREGRPTVAGLSGESGFWLLDTRAREWEHIDTGVPLVLVAAVDDADGHVVALDAEGRVHVYAEGEQLAVTEVLVEGSGGSLVVDDRRAYLNDTDTGVVLEIDYADGARLVRSIETPTTATFFAEVGR